MYCATCMPRLRFIFCRKPSPEQGGAAPFGANWRHMQGRAAVRCKRVPCVAQRGWGGGQRESERERERERETDEREHAQFGMTRRRGHVPSFGLTRRKEGFGKETAATENNGDGEGLPPMKYHEMWCHNGFRIGIKRSSSCSP